MDSVNIKAILQSAIEVTAELLRASNIFFEKELPVRNYFDYFCTIELRRIDL